MTPLVYLLMIHFVGDFILQSNWMALNKSRNWLALSWHVLVYSLCFFPCGTAFVGLTAISHFCTDAITSRITSRLWFVRDTCKANMDHSELPNRATPYVYVPVYFADKRHWFFVAIGADQLIHAVTLALTWSYLYGR